MNKCIHPVETDLGLRVVVTSQPVWETAAQAPHVCVYIHAELPSCSAGFPTYNVCCRYVSLGVVSDLGAFPQWVTRIGIFRPTRVSFNALTFRFVYISQLVLNRQPRQMAGPTEEHL